MTAIPFIAALHVLTVNHAEKSMSAAAILARCQQAYDSVKTFEEDVTATHGKKVVTAHIACSRPGRLCVSGVSNFGSNYKLLAVGDSVDVLYGAKWTHCDNFEDGLMMASDFSGTAGTTVSALLMHNEWGSPQPDSDAKYKVSEQKIKGSDTYCLECGGDSPSMVWIDKKTYCLVQTRSFGLGVQFDVVFVPPKVNQAIPPSRFKK